MGIFGEVGEDGEVGEANRIRPKVRIAIDFRWAIIDVCVERSGSGIELRTLDYENPGSNPGCGVKTLGKFFPSTLPIMSLLQFTQLKSSINEYLAIVIDSGDMCTSSLRALIVAYGWMLPREAEMVSE